MFSRSWKFGHAPSLSGAKTLLGADDQFEEEDCDLRIKSSRIRMDTGRCLSFFLSSPLSLVFLLLNAIELLTSSFTTKIAQLEVSRLRSEARVAGILIGTLPSIAQQNVFLGLPLLLLPEEVAFLVDKGIAELHDDSTMSNSHDCPTSIQLRPDQSAQPQISIESAVAAAAGMGVAKECSGSSILTESRMVSSVRGDESKEEGEKEETTKKMLEEDAAPVMDREEGDDGSSTLPQPHSLLPQPKPPTELAMSIKAELELGSNGNNDNDNNILTEQEGDDAVNKVEEDGEKEIDRKKPTSLPVEGNSFPRLETEDGAREGNLKQRDQPFVPAAIDDELVQPPSILLASPTSPLSIPLISSPSFHLPNTPTTPAAATSAQPTLASASNARTIEIPTTSISFPWYNPRVYSSLADARIAGIWSYPSNVEERARCAVFRDLSEKGYYMGSGLKFGGDWLVYPGDPLRYHSHFVATVFSRPTSTLRPIDVVAFGRLGTATRKTHLLCGYDDETGIVDYYSIEWAGFG